MKHIPTLLKRGTNGLVMDAMAEGMEILQGVPGVRVTVMVDGRAVWVREHNGLLQVWWRKDLRPGEVVPDGWEPAEERPKGRDWHGWERCEDNPIVREAFRNWTKAYLKGIESGVGEYPDTKYPLPGTYELIDPSINGGNERWWCPEARLIPHGAAVLKYPPETFDEFKRYFEEEPVEGLVFWLLDEPVAKLKRQDFNLPWPCRSLDS